jgi:hypothetical protein
MLSPSRVISCTSNGHKQRIRFVSKVHDVLDDFGRHVLYDRRPIIRDYRLEYPVEAFSDICDIRIARFVNREYVLLEWARRRLAQKVVKSAVTLL